MLITLMIYSEGQSGIRDTCYELFLSFWIDIGEWYSVASYALLCSELTSASNDTFSRLLKRTFSSMIIEVFFYGELPVSKLSLSV